MNSIISEPQSTLLAYFSHSYRPTEKEINLFFWEILSKHHLYFTVDSEENRDNPMDITYLEWMMRRCACFVAVIPRRDDELPDRCSPYQVFENGLAIRAKKPRLIFVEAGLDETKFGVQPDEVCTFRRREEWLLEDKEQFVKAAERLARKARAFAAQDLDLRKPVGFLADPTPGKIYDTGTIRSVRRIITNQGYSFKAVNPMDFEHDFLLLEEIEKYSVLISEIRPPHISTDVLGLLHSRCIPTIRICHLEDSENAEYIKAVMHLSREEDKWSDKEERVFPIVLSKYQIDERMEPIIFWKDIKELGLGIAERLRKITEQRADLISEQEARDYFLRIGRLSGKVFISNAKAQNEFVYQAKKDFRRNAVSWFHYKDKDAITIGSSDWLSEVVMEIRNSVIFVALIDSHYIYSKWCMSELEEAMDLFHKGAIEIHAYVIEPGAELPPGLSMMQVDFVENLEEADKISRIVANTVRYLETGKQVGLRPRDRERIVELLAKLPSFASLNERKTTLRDASLPEQIVDKVPTDAQTSTLAAGQIVDSLAKVEREIQPRTKALGMLLSHAMGLVDSIEEQRFLAGMIRGYWLLPDIKLKLAPNIINKELSLVYLHQRKEIGTCESLLKGSLVNPQLHEIELSTNVYAMLAKYSADQDSWQHGLQTIGHDLGTNPGFARTLSEYEHLLDAQGIRSEWLSFCFATDTTGFRVPFEWTIARGQNVPLCLYHPIRRCLLNYPESRETIRELLEGDVAIPLRVLLIASNTQGNIPQVEHEIEELAATFHELFASVGWPDRNICCLNTQAAIPKRIEAEIKFGNYHLLHFAGHSGYDTRGRPVLEVYQDSDMQQVTSISATTLRSWIADSDLRFVYLSSCRSASTEIPEISNEIQLFEGLGQAAIDAHVPEAIGFVWPITDNDSRTFAMQFYSEFLKGFNALLSLYHARKFFEVNNQVWAAPILIQQTDSPHLQGRNGHERDNQSHPDAIPRS